MEGVILHCTPALWPVSMGTNTDAVTRNSNQIKRKIKHTGHGGTCLVTGRIGPAQESEPSQVKGVLSFIGLGHCFCLLSSQQSYCVRQHRYFQQVSQSTDAERSNEWLKVSQQRTGRKWALRSRSSSSQPEMSTLTKTLAAPRLGKR